MIIPASLKALAAVPGISSVSDVSETDGQPAMLVEFSTGVKGTISKNEVKGTFEMKLEYPSGGKQFRTGLTADDVVWLLNADAFSSANVDKRPSEVMASILKNL